MSLVAYDQSDDSDEEDTFSPQLQIPIVASQKRKEGVKITIPSLKEFEDDECPVVSKKLKIQTTSGLFSMLPPPKNTSTLTKPGFVPYVLSSKKASAIPASSKFKTKVSMNETSKVIAPDILEEQNSDEEVSHINDSSDGSHDILSRDFFSLDSVKTENKLNDKNYLQQNLQNDGSLSPIKNDSLIQKTSLSEPVLSETYSNAEQSFMNEAAETSYVQQDSLPINYVSSNVQENSTEIAPDSYVLYSGESAFESNSKESLLKNKEFLKLQGRRQEFEAADIIDVNADDQLTNKNEWLMKSLTEESTHRPSRKKCNMPTQQQKRKHQITYLAFQAKEREMDLKNQWAMNSRTRRETQAKYGF